MARVRRLLVKGQAAVYHVMSHTALDGFPLGDEEKDFLLTHIQSLSCLFFTEILGFCIMGNHFHILLRMLPGELFSDEEIRRRFDSFYGKEKVLLEDQIPYYRERWANLSEFMKDIKSGFSRYYNKRYDRRGYFWSDRFKSVIVENGRSLLNCLAYIDLNPIRAGIVERPEDYRWSSFGYHVLTKNAKNFLSLDFGLEDKRGTDDIFRFQHYREFVYATGALKTDKGSSLKKEILEKNIPVPINKRNRYFSDAAVIGSKGFVTQTYQVFKDHFQAKREKVPRPIEGFEGIFSLKRIKQE